MQPTTEYTEEMFELKRNANLMIRQPSVKTQPLQEAGIKRIVQQREVSD